MKAIISLLLLVFSLTGAVAQNGFVAGGLSLLVGADMNQGEAIALPALTVFPGFKLLQKKGFTLLAGSPASIGATDKDGHFAVGIDVPVSLSLLSGYGFGNVTRKRVGFFLGGGAGYHNSYDEIDNADGSVEHSHLEFLGFMIHSGIVLPMSKSDTKSGVLLRLSWMSSYPDHRKNVIGLGLIAW